MIHEEVEMLITVFKSICKKGSLRVFAVHALSRVRVVGQSDLSLDKYCGVTRRTFVACEGGGDRVRSVWTNTAV